jgi:hypothetical protein
VGGLLTSTVLTLFVVPIMYTLLMKDPLPPEVDLDAESAGRPAPIRDRAVLLDDGNGGLPAKRHDPVPGAYNIPERKDRES